MGWPPGREVASEAAGEGLQAATTRSCALPERSPGSPSFCTQVSTDHTREIFDRPTPLFQKTSKQIGCPSVLTPYALLKKAVRKCCFHLSRAGIAKDEMTWSRSEVSSVRS